MSDFVSPPSLTSWGIEEVEANVCVDSFENRQKLTHAGVPFRVFEAGLIEVLFDDYEGLNKHHADQFSKKKIILSNPRDPWSDYLAFDELPLDFMESAPAWMQRHLNKYRDAVAEGLPARKVPILPTRCRRVRADGSRCWQWSWPNEASKGFCRTHGDKYAFNASAQMAALNDAAKMRLSQLSEPALAALEDLLLNSTVPHVKLKASTEVLDRIGIRGGSELSVSGEVSHSVESPAEAVESRLRELAERLEGRERELEAESSAGPVIDVEVVEVVADDE